MPFGFKYPLILNNAIVNLDGNTSCKYSTSYSYYPSGLNLTTHIAKSLNHFITALPSLLQTKWYLACLLELLSKPQTTLSCNSLYPPFEVYLTTIDGQYLKTKNYRIWKEEESLRPTEVGTFTTPSFQLSYKGKKDFGISQILVKLFLKFFHLILRPPTLNGTGLNETF